ncbi:MAG: tRNA dihydrouridine synthase [Candidatus Thorarchaeota archaeon]
MKIGPLFLENNLILAPMMDITTGPYRRFCRKFNNIGMVSVPMLYTKRIVANPKSIEGCLHNIEQERPVSVQLIGSNLSALKNSLEYLSSYKFDILDINAGCPSKRAIRAKEGGYLLKDPKLLNAILEIACKYSPQPVSLKIRIGFNKSDNLHDIIQVINNSNISLLTVHGRCVRDKFERTSLNLEAIKQMKNVLNIPIVGNGDIYNPTIAKKFIEYTKVDALMIGRGSMGNPEIFRRIDKFLSNSDVEPFSNDFQKMQQYGASYEKCLDEYIASNPPLICSSDHYKFIELKRNMIWFTKQIKNSTDIRINLAKTKNLYELKKKLEDIYN